MKTVNSAVVGLGIGMAHVAGHLVSPHCKLTAVADAWPVRRESVGGAFSQGSMLNLRPLFDEATTAKRWQDLGIRVYKDVGEVADDAGIEFVSLCTPDDTHEEYAIRLLQAGKHLLLEKPMALSLPAAERIVSAAHEHNRRVAIGYEMRINPAILKIKELIGGGVVGEVQAFNLQQFRPAFRRDKWQHWIQKKERSGGLVVEETCHWFDLARYLTGREVVQVHCVANDKVHSDFDYEDIAFVQGNYDSGGIFQIGHSLTGFDFSLIIQVYGTDGSVWCGMKGAERSLLDNGQSSHIAVVSWGPTDPSRGAGQTVTFGDEAMEGQSIRDYVVHTAGAIVSGSLFLAEPEDGLRSLQIAFAARRSIESGRVEDV